MTLHARLPHQFATFALVFGVALVASLATGAGLRGFLTAFDVAALAFLIHVGVTFRQRSSDRLRAHAEAYDPSRSALVAVTALVLAAVVGAIVAELVGVGEGQRRPMLLALITLVAAWTFGNTIFAIRYAHLFYSGLRRAPPGPGLIFPSTAEPDFWDFCYLAFTIGMTFQVSDVVISEGRMRRYVGAHALLAFAFNIGAVALTVNVVAGSR